MNQQQRRYILTRLEEERDKQLAKFPNRVTKADFWPDLSNEQINRKVSAIIEFAQSNFPEMNFSLAGINAQKENHYNQGSFSLYMGPTTLEKNKMAYPDVSQQHGKIIAASKKIADEIMLGDCSEALKKLEEFANMQF